MPIEAIPLEQEVLALAAKLTEPPTVLLFAGELIYTVAKAGTDKNWMNANEKHRNTKRYFDMHTPPNKDFLAFRRSRCGTYPGAPWRGRVEFREWSGEVRHRLKRSCFQQLAIQGDTGTYKFVISLEGWSSCEKHTRKTVSDKGKVPYREHSEVHPRQEGSIGRARTPGAPSPTLHQWCHFADFVSRFQEYLTLP